MNQLTLALSDVFNFGSILSLLIGLIAGYIVGVLPGLNRVTALAIGLPFTYHLSPLAAISLLIGISKGGAAGGAITSILLNTPGEPSSAATCLDGYPLTRQGKARKALGTALYSAFFGDFFATIILILSAAPLAKVALMMGPIEVCSVLFFSLTFIAALSGTSLIKGLLAGLLGLFFANVGLDVETALPRLTFGFVDLYDGVPLLAVGVGVLALSEMMLQIEAAVTSPAGIQAAGESRLQSQEGLKWSEFKALLRTLVRGSVIGTVIGILPGLGATIASFLSYALAKKASKHPERYGKGELEGVAAAESADNAVTAGALIPLFALGIPGSVGAAMLIGALMVHGVTPGPLMFEQNPRLIYGIYGTMVLASFLILPIGRFGLKVFSQLTRIPDSFLCPVIVYLCFIGAYMEGSGMFAVWLVILFGVLGYLMKKLDLSFVTFLIGFILGPMIELSLRQSLITLQGSWTRLFQHPIAMVFVLLTLLSAWRLSLMGQKLGKA
jgi:putative tricarboxylic transport membrane protein